MTLFQRFMRVLTHPQHAGEPLPSKKSKPAKAAKAGRSSAPMRAKASAAQAPTPNDDAVAVALAEPVQASPKIPTTPSRPVEVFSPDRPNDADNDDAPLGGGSLLDDLDDSSLGLGESRHAGSSMHPSADTPAEASTAMVAPEDDAASGRQIGEVFELIEKLRDHVDAQNGRFEQAMGALDQIRTSAEALPEIRERIDSMVAFLDELKASQFRGHEKVERALAAQSARLDTIAQAIERATQREERLAESLVDINQTILAVSTTNDRLANAIEAMRRHEAERDARIGRALTGAQRWLIVLTLVMVIGMIATIITAVAAGG